MVLLLWRRVAHRPQAVSEDELLQLCLGDKSQAERLIALEGKTAPGISRSEAIARAVYSIRRGR
jgi:hypothetical protein